MNQDRVQHLLELAQLRLLVCECPDKANALAAEINELKSNLYRRRKRAFKYRDNHNAFQRTGVGQ